LALLRFARLRLEWHLGRDLPHNSERGLDHLVRSQKDTDKFF